MQLRKVTQGDPTAAINRNGELNVVDFSVSWQPFLSHGSPVDDNLYQSKSTLNDRFIVPAE